MIITNSLGSNYTEEDQKLVLRLIFQPWKWKEGHALLSLREAIATKQSVTRLPREVTGRYLPRNDYTPKVQLFMKGRQAIEEALRQIGVKTGDGVVVQAFTCIAVVEPILNMGAVPIYADVVSKSLNPSLENIKKVVSDKTKAIILQHTLGYVNPENEEICEWCEKRKITVIQDLAHAVGSPALTAAFLEDSPHRVRTVFFRQPIILSFSQDKVFDGITGGALLTTNDKIQMTSAEIFKQLLYPLITYAIRLTYNLGIGKAIHFLSKKLGLMNSPIYTPKETALPNVFAALALQQFNKLDKIIEHRKKIALQYNELINKEWRIVDKNDVENGSNLRYPLWINNRDELEKELQKRRFYLLDHWYDSPVSPKWIKFSEVNYIKGSCQNAESLSNHIFNLPTHVSINLEKGRELAMLINKYAE